jgi:signal transduction histidine kinase
MPPDGRTPLEILFVLGNLALAIGLSFNARRRRFFFGAIPLLCYLLTQALSALALSGKRFGPPFDSTVFGLVAEYLAVIAPTMLLGATLVFIRSGRRAAWLPLIPPVALAIAALALDARVFGLRGASLAISSGIGEGLHKVTGALSWASALGLAIVIAWRTRVISSSPLHRNRLRYWIGALLLATAGDMMTFALPEQIVSPLAGAGVALLGSGLAVITWGLYYLPDMRVGARRALSYILLTIITFAIYLAGIRLAQSAFRVESGQEPLLGAVLVATVLAIGYGPLIQGVQALTRRILGHTAVDYAASLKEYSQRITHVLDLEPLAQIAVGTVNAALGASRGALLLAQSNAEDDLILEAIGGTSLKAREQLVCPANGPIPQRWRAGGGALLQYDVDVLPAFRGVSAAERATLAHWNMEIFLPLRSMGTLVGVLALGSKRSRDPYFDSDMAYLATIADETGVALQNAKLFSGLRDANQQMEDLNRDLEHANEQLQELDKLKSAFIGVITHELRSPFAALDFSVQLIQRYGLDNLLPEQREQLAQLSEGLRRAQTMINNLITLASFLSKQGQLRMALVDMRQLVSETVATLEPMARKREVTLTLDMPVVLPAVQGDRERLSEAIYHLVQNGIKFNREGGTVTIACRAGLEDMLVEVSDTGVGIEPEKLPEMWKDFTQVADPLRRGVEGLGLGLPLVRYVVKAHGGQVWARSQPGQGSVFGFRIPMKARQPSGEKQ